MRSLYAGLLLIGLGTAAVRAEISLDRDLASGDHLLRGPNCEALRVQERALRAWRAHLGESSPGANLPCEPSSDGKSFALRGIQKIVPAAVLPVLGSAPLCSGPNCFNAAMVSAGILKFFRQSSDTEFSYWLASPLCTAVPAGTTPQPGDIGAIRQGSREAPQEVHGFVYLTDSLAFSKNGRKTSSRYELQSPDSMLKEYEVKAECRNAAKASAFCEPRVEYFRCRTLDAYLATRPAATRASVKSCYLALDSLDQSLANRALLAGKYATKDEYKSHCRAQEPTLFRWHVKTGDLREPLDEGAAVSGDPVVDGGLRPRLESMSATHSAMHPDATDE